jgi:hypothetical protein
MMALDSYNVLDTYPLPGLDQFIAQCLARDVKQIYLTGTNTDPLLYKHLPKLTKRIRAEGFLWGVRTNAVANIERLRMFDMGSVSIVSFNPKIYQAMMGQGRPPQIEQIVALTERWFTPLKINIVLGPENVRDVYTTLDILRRAGIQRVNLREPYGQPHVGDPLRAMTPARMMTLGMPTYQFDQMSVTYWDVHYVEVESVNLYASGRVSETYPITLGHADTGEVHDQTFFPGGRVREQWLDAA